MFMKKNQVVYQTRIPKFTYFKSLFICSLFYLTAVINHIQITVEYVLFTVPFLVLLYVYVQFVNPIFILCENQLIVRYPFRPFLNKYIFELQNVVEIIQYDRRAFTVWSEVIITTKDRKKRVPYVDGGKTISELLKFVEAKGVKVVINS